MGEGQKLVGLGRWLSVIMGLVLLVAGLLKAADVELFMAQIRAYDVFTHPVPLLAGAWGLVAVQCTLGAALIVGYRPGRTLPFAALIWLILLGGTGWAAWTGATDECGCFGALLERSPKFAFVENLFFLAATLFAWSTLKRAPAATRPIQRATVAVACLLGVLLPFAFGVPIASTLNPDKDALPVLRALKDLEVSGIDTPELDRGTHLLFLLSTDCMHCLDALPLLDELAEAEGIPPLVGICPNRELDRLSFIEQFAPAFPLGRVKAERFLKLLTMGETPQVLLVRDGVLLGAWDNGAVPGPEEITARLKEKGR